MDNRSDIAGYSALEELAFDLIWSWNRSADAIWRQLDEKLFDATRNPWIVLQTVSREKLKTLLSQKDFRQTIDSLLKTHVHSSAKTWLQEKQGEKTLSSIAYFSMEFMLSEALPIYSGGLGHVAGDQLKAASDLGVPVIGIGLLYQQGYFRQIIDFAGDQQAAYPFNAPSELPIQPLRTPDGQWLRIEIVLPGWSLWLRAWEAKIGRAKLYLLDTNDLANYPVYRGITSELYGGDLEMRLRQELVLGIGGVRLLELLHIKPEVCHLNEGHAAFAILERTRQCMKEENISFEEAFSAVRAGHLFTTHTAVAAAFDRFPSYLIEKYLGSFAEKHLKIPISQLLELGTEENHPGWFNMASLAIRGSGAVNAVSRLHGHVSRRLFASLFPRFPIDEVPIGYITNGVHTPTWMSAPAETLWKEEIKLSPISTEKSSFDPTLSLVSDERIWAMRNEARHRLVEYGRKQIPSLLAARGASITLVEEAKSYLDPKKLTLGFARRFASYKRPNMLLFDPDRLKQIVTHSERPVQLLIAGKAHPADIAGQQMIREWIAFINQPEIRPHVLFLSDYDMLMAEKLVQGVDLWINTPRRPWEACGTSGMKVLANGGLNLSELDGWWAEAYTPEVGWALGDGQEHAEDPAEDEKEALQLYNLLEQEIIPLFYQRNEQGIPTGWVQRIRNSLLRLTPLFCAHRAVAEYTENHYIPAAAQYKNRKMNGCKLAKEIAAWQKLWREQVQTIVFEKLEILPEPSCYHYKLSLNLGPFKPSQVSVELYAEGHPPLCQQMEKTEQKNGAHLYEIRVPSNRPANDYCPRIVPNFPGVNAKLEAPYILWQR